ncbi:MAG: 2-C-methyl-D-erythritol 4-phosphate cytidylyltransferase [Candidatus Gastranaerophilales bacterium]|nr:2-C-methyl-D-erythritol 4-phosphate cytidylyltransferase [Candidatus Gastranaerophilales bacterium]
MISVIITAGGTSSRFSGMNKLLFKIQEKPIIQITTEKFSNLEYIDEIIISANKLIIDNLKEIFTNNKKIKIVTGGKTRQESVFNGLKACSTKTDYVIIHDGARPFIKEETILKCLKKAEETGAAIVAVKSIDTIKIVNNKGQIMSTPDRNTLWNAQTPQIFDYNLIYNAHEKFKNENFTDDALLIEKLGKEVYTVEGEYSNIKITTVEDVKF